ncbi:MAG: acyl-CoA thioesterase [Trueperaceae bacterium]
MTYRTDIQVRFNDTDALRHLNNTAYALYAEQARVNFFQSLGMSEVALILAHISLDFRKQVKFGDTVYVETTVEKVGNSSVTLIQNVLANDVLAVETKSVVVLFDYKAQQPKTIPEDLRRGLEAYRG